MGASAEHVRAHIAGNATLATTYLGLFQRDAAATPAEDVLVDAAKVMAASQETLVSLRAPFDAFRDRLAAGKGKVAADDAYPIAARRGLQVFIGTGQCIRCHAGPSFTHGGFERLHKDAPPVTQAADLGRYAGVRRLHDNPYNLRSRFNDSGTRIPFWAGRGHDVGRGRANKGMFRVPGLRGTKDTAPYMHDGSVTMLAEAVAHPVPPAQFSKTYRRKLTAAEIADLVAFLETLSPP